MAGRGRGRGLTLPAWMTTTPPQEMMMNGMEYHVTEEDSQFGMPGSVPAPTIAPSSQPSSIPGQYSDAQYSEAHYQFQRAAAEINANFSQQQYSHAQPAAIPQDMSGHQVGLQQIPGMGYPQTQYYTPFNPGHIPNSSNPLSQVTVAITPSQLIRPSQTVVLPVVPVNGMPGMYAGTGPVAGQNGTVSAQPSQQLPTLNDANNDASSWTEHEGEDGRVYWHNRVTKTSTYDKPECLKCPEERSIPPCRWKEYSSNGKKYYSDGVESSWTVPEEYSEWKARVDAAVARRKTSLQQQHAAPSATPSVSNSVITSGSHELSTSSSQVSNRELKRQQQTRERLEAAGPIPEIQYATKEEAIEAFRSLLEESLVTSQMKFKEVQDLCTKDPRWLALKSAGERKQHLAEYQTKKMKAEKEEKKLKSRRARDFFFQLLVEHHEIDSNTRWRAAIPLLENDRRYKDIEDERDREEYFHEFISELTKKEREERELAKKETSKAFAALLESLAEAGKLTPRTSWVDLKSENILVFEQAKFNSLEESEKRRIFQDFLNDLIVRQRNEEKRQKYERQQLLEAKRESFRKDIYQKFSNGEITSEMTWRDVRPLVLELASYLDLSSSLEKENYLPKGFDPRDITEDILLGMREENRFNKRLFRDILDHYRIEITHSTSTDELLDKFCAIFDRNKKRDPTIEYQLTSREMSALDDLLTFKQSNLLGFMTEEIGYRQKDYEESERQRKKRENRYLDLLTELYYRSDQVSITWDEGKKDLVGLHEYESLDKSDRKRLFYDHMKELASKLPVKLAKATTSVSKSEIIITQEVPTREDKAIESSPQVIANGSHKSDPQQDIFQPQSSEIQSSDPLPISHDPVQATSLNHERDSPVKSFPPEGVLIDEILEKKRDRDPEYQEREKEDKESSRKKSRHDEEESDYEGSGKSGKSKKDRKDRDRDRDREREKEREKEHDRDKKKHKKHKKDSREDRSRSRSREHKKRHRSGS